MSGTRIPALVALVNFATFHAGDIVATDAATIASFVAQYSAHQIAHTLVPYGTQAVGGSSSPGTIAPTVSGGSGGASTVPSGTGTTGGGTAGTGAGLTAAQQTALSPTGDVSSATVGTLTLAQLAAEVAQIAGIALDPSGTGAAPTGPTTISVAGTYQALCAPGSIANGAYLQNPPSNKVPLYVDTAGATGTSLAPTSIAIQPGQTWRTVFKPTNAVTVFSTAPISFQAGTF